MSNEYAQSVLRGKFPELLMEISEYLSFVDTNNFVTNQEIIIDFETYMES